VLGRVEQPRARVPDQHGLPRVGFLSVGWVTYGWAGEPQPARLRRPRNARREGGPLNWGWGSSGRATRARLSAPRTPILNLDRPKDDPGAAVVDADGRGAQWSASRVARRRRRAPRADQVVRDGLLHADGGAGPGSTSSGESEETKKLYGLTSWSRALRRSVPIGPAAGERGVRFRPGVHQRRE
jgi:hypothetical protein